MNTYLLASAFALSAMLPKNPIYSTALLVAAAAMIATTYITRA
jgi:NADH:ubiquinone oxidoreductase subunit 6 (subunit J)